MNHCSYRGHEFREREPIDQTVIELVCIDYDYYVVIRAEKETTNDE